MKGQLQITFVHVFTLVWHVLYRYTASIGITSLKRDREEEEARALGAQNGTLGSPLIVFLSENDSMTFLEEDILQVAAKPMK